jgi:outer membrane protein assembly factor BamB
MHRYRRIACALLVTFGASFAPFAKCADWRQFRGPDGLGISNEKNLPAEWSDTKNIVWKVKLPGAGASSPVTLGNRIFVTCYSGYGMDTKEPGDMKELKRHLLCLDRKAGKSLWAKEFEPELPEHRYTGEGAYHGYAASTPITDGQRLYVFFGKSGVYCFDLNGKQLWRTSVGKNTNGWGSGASPILYKNLLIVNASVESGSMIALDKMTGKEVWKAPKIGSAWNTPMPVAKMEFNEWCQANGFEPDKLTEKQTATLKQLHAVEPVELVVNVQGRVVAVDPDTGKELWFADGVKSYVCPSVVAHKGLVYMIGGGSVSMAIRTGGRGNVTDTHVLWKQKKGSNASSPIYHDGYLYWASENGGVLHCQDAGTGKEAYSQRLAPAAGRIWASPVLADGKLYYISQFKGVFVVAAGPKFELVAHNVFTDDNSRANASVAVSDGQLLLRNDQYLYCIGNR